MKLFSVYRGLSEGAGRAVRRLPATRTPLPRVGYLLLTRRCNVACSMCFLRAHAGGPPPAPELTGPEWIALIRGLPRPALLSLTGGEPLLHPAFHDIFRAAAGRGPVALETNATRLDAAEARWLLGASPLRPTAGLTVLSVSIHGPPEVHDRLVGREGAFAEAAAGVEHVARLRGRRGLPRIAVRAVVQPETLVGLTALPALVRHLGADELVLSVHGSAPDVMDPSQPSSCGSPSLPTPIAAEEIGPVLEQVLASPEVPVQINPAGPIPEIVNLYRGVWDPRAHDCLFPWTRFIVSAQGDLGVRPTSGWAACGSAPSARSGTAKPPADTGGSCATRRSFPPPVRAAAAGCGGADDSRAPSAQRRTEQGGEQMWPGDLQRAVCQPRQSARKPELLPCERRFFPGDPVEHTDDRPLPRLRLVLGPGRGAPLLPRRAGPTFPALHRLRAPRGTRPGAG